MKDDPQRFPIGYIVARAAERVDWSAQHPVNGGAMRARISVFFENFVRHSDDATIERLRDLIKRQGTRIAELEAGVHKSGGGVGLGGFAIATGLAAGMAGLIGLRRRRAAAAWMIGAALFAGSIALAQDFEITRFTIAAGSGVSTGGDFELAATAGQHDAAAAMTGGEFELAGGFWTVAATGVCTQPGDINVDGEIDGDDMQLFVDCLFGTNGANCICADLDGGGVSSSDVAFFVSALLGT